MSTRTKSKTVAAALACTLGSLGIHRFYLHGLTDTWGWAHAIPTALGLWGVDRVLMYGQDDKLSWLLLPLLGFSIAVACLTAIVYALQTPEQWNRWHNTAAANDHPAGRTHYGTVLVLVLSLMLGATSFLTGIAFSFQRYFEYQVEEGLKISQ